MKDYDMVDASYPARLVVERNASRNLVPVSPVNSSRGVANQIGEQSWFIKISLGKKYPLGVKRS